MSCPKIRASELLIIELTGDMCLGTDLAYDVLHGRPGNLLLIAQEDHEIHHGALQI